MRDGRHPFHTVERRELRPEEWPAADRTAWQAATAVPMFLQDVSPGATWRPSTRHRVEQSYGAYLGWLQREGLLDLNTAAGASIDKQKVDAFLHFRLGFNRPRTVETLLDGLHLYALAIGVEALVDTIGEMRRRFRRRFPHASQALRNVQHASELLRLGIGLMEGAAEVRSMRQAVRYRDGLAIALLSLRPLRRANIVALTLGRHLVRRAGRWYLTIEAHETKGKRPIDKPLPRLLEGFLDHYLATVRPVLLKKSKGSGSDHARLWYSIYGQPLSEYGFYIAIVTRTAAAFGTPMGPHRFRHSAATTLAIEDPARVRIAAQILDHADFRTTEDHYRISRMAEASLVYEDVLQQLQRSDP